MNAAQSAISDAVHTATLTRETQGAYDTATGVFAVTTAVQAGRATVASSAPIEDMFPSYIVGPGDQLILLEGFTACAENDILAFAGLTLKVRRVQDIAAAGTLFYCVAR